MRLPEFCHRIKNRPPRKKPGEVAFYVPQRLATKRHEIALSIMFAANRRLFGHAYSGLQPGYFRQMPSDSGVYITFAVPTAFLTSEVSKPGDIDILIVPYEKDQLILHRSVAVEVKALRATYLRQGKSPNEFGFSQANGLLTIGFPFVAVAHLIVSNTSPHDSWREMGLARILDREGNVKLLDPTLIDCLPMDLIERSFGRLIKASQDSRVGLIAAYISMSETEMSDGYWHPDTRPAEPSMMVREKTLQKIADYFDRYPQLFLDTPRHDPVPG